MALLRRGGMTVDELAAGLGLRGNAIRPQLAVLERDGFVERTGVRRGAQPSDPSRLMTSCCTSSTRAWGAANSMR